MQSWVSESCVILVVFIFTSYFTLFILFLDARTRVQIAQDQTEALVARMNAVTNKNNAVSNAYLGHTVITPTEVEKVADVMAVSRSRKRTRQVFE